jgi:2-methylcitrate dehydratase PrpD
VYDAGKCDTKDLLAGYAARNGIYAAKLAAFGFQGPPGALDGPYGYFHAFGPGYDPAYLDNIGKTLALAEASFKPHAGCRHVHACVDATQDLLSRVQPALADITAIEIDSYKNAITPDFRVNYTPDTVGQAGFSLPVTVSVILTRGSWYREDIETFDSPEARRLRALVKVGLDEAIQAAYPDKNGCEVRITTRDGRQHKGRVEHAKGEPENMLTDAEFEQKFRRLVGDLLPPERVADLIDATGRLEHLSDVGELVRLTRKAMVAV